MEWPLDLSQARIPSCPHRRSHTGCGHHREISENGERETGARHPHTMHRITEGGIRAWRNVYDVVLEPGAPRRFVFRRVGPPLACAGPNSVVRGGEGEPQKVAVDRRDSQ